MNGTTLLHPIVVETFVQLFLPLIGVETNQNTIRFRPILLMNLYTDFYTQTYPKKNCPRSPTDLFRKGTSDKWGHWGRLVFESDKGP